MITKNKTKYEVETITRCLSDYAVEEAGAIAFRTFMGGNIEISNDYQIPLHAICAVKVNTSTEQIEIDDPTCQSGDEPTPPTPGKPRIEGANNTSVRQGIGFDLLDEVHAYDGDGNEIPFTVTPSEFDECKLGKQTFTYEAEGVTKTRTITVTPIPNPTINGLTDIVVTPNEEFDPIEGLTAVDGNGNPIEVKEN